MNYKFHYTYVHRSTFKLQLGPGANNSIAEMGPDAVDSIAENFVHRQCV